MCGGTPEEDLKRRKMKTRQIDPRYVRWTDEEPSYRVDFWDASTASDEYLLEEAEDFAEVMRWAHENADGRDIVVYAQHRQGDDFGLVRLHGREPV